MPLVKCRDCGADVSDRAPYCPKCGAPMAMLDYAAPDQTVLRASLIEATAKRWKAVQFIGGLLLLAGIVGAIFGGESWVWLGILVAVVGAVVYFVGRIGGWWHHG